MKRPWRIFKPDDLSDEEAWALVYAHYRIDACGTKHTLWVDMAPDCPYYKLHEKDLLAVADVVTDVKKVAYILTATGRELAKKFPPERVAELAVNARVNNLVARCIAKLPLEHLPTYLTSPDQYLRVVARTRQNQLQQPWRKVGRFFRRLIQIRRP